MLTFFHKLFNPHCEHCREEREESKFCSTCDVLRIQLTHEREEKERLLNRLLEPKPEIVEIRNNDKATLPSTTVLPWAVKRQILEAEDREKARVLRERTETLEKEVIGGAES